MRRARAGFSILEVVVGTFVLSVAVLASVALQTTAVSTGARVRRAQTVTAAARAELDAQRGLIVRATGECLTAVPAGLGCGVEIVPCALLSGALTCDAAVTAPVADRVRVRVVSGLESTSLTTLVVR
jgi:type II secretory pathway pseudopilin PulG